MLNQVGKPPLQQIAPVSMGGPGGNMPGPPVSMGVPGGKCWQITVDSKHLQFKSF